MDQYFTSVRELEQRLHSSEEWEYKPKPVVDGQAAGGHRRRARVRREDAADVRRDEARAGDRLDAAHLAVHRHDGDPQHHAPRQPARGARRAARRRKKAQFDALDGFLTALDGDEGGRRVAARPHDGALRHAAWAAPTRTRTSTCRCCSPAAASSTASTWPSTRRTTTR